MTSFPKNMFKILKFVYIQKIKEHFSIVVPKTKPESRLVAFL